MIELELVKNFLIAVALGALIGLEREMAQAKRKFKAFAGIRTFTLIALFGALAALLSDKFSIWILIISFIVLSSLIIIAYYFDTISKKIGATTEVAGLLTFFIGVLSYYDMVNFAVLVTIIIVLFLYGRYTLHKLAKKIKRKEMYATLEFAIIAFVILPFLPDKWLGPFKAFNPYMMWLIVVLVSGISLIGYIMDKWLGKKGIELTGILGGLISSNQLAVSFSGKSKKVRFNQALIFAVLISNTVMIGRMLTELFILNQNLFYRSLFSLLLIGLVVLVVSLFYLKKIKKQKYEIEFKSPFTLKPALIFTVLFVVVLFLVKIAISYQSSVGVYITSFLAGLIKTDLVTVSVAELSSQGLAEHIAVNSLIIAALTNIGVKGLIAYIFGSKKFAKSLSIMLAISILISLAVLLII